MAVSPHLFQLFGKKTFFMSMDDESTATNLTLLPCREKKRRKVKTIFFQQM
jgi:hypothetical protein